MKQFFMTTMMLLGMCLGVSAQWTNLHDSYSGECVVYAGLVDASGNPIQFRGYTLAAFIGDECRGEVQAQYNSNSAGFYFPLRVGGESADNGKSLSFRLKSVDGITYDVAAVRNVTYSNEGTISTPSSLLGVKFVQPETITTNGAVELKVGDEVNLCDYLSVVPASANIPTNIRWDASDYFKFVTVTGNTLKAINPTYPSSIQVFPTLDGYEIPALEVTINQPIVSLALSQEFASGKATVNVGDVQSLEYVLGTCYTVNPENASEVPVWSSSNPSIIKKVTDGSGNESWVPAAPGTCTMTLTAANGKKIQLTVIVVQPVESVTGYNETIYANVGEDLNSILAKAYTILPLNASNKNVTFTSSDTRVVNASMKAVAGGNSSITIASEEAETLKVVIPVVVRENATITVAKDPVTYRTTDGDVTEAFMGNFTITPSSAEYSVTSSNSDVFVLERQDSQTYYAAPVATGSSTITVKLFYYHTEIVDDVLKTVEKTESKTFVVNVVSGLTSFYVPDVLASRENAAEFTIEPEPASADFDIDDVEVVIEMPENANNANFYETSIQKVSGLKYEVTPIVLGEASIVVYYKGEKMGSGQLNVGQGITPKNGWEWISLYAGPYDDIQGIYGNSLVEIRSQGDLLYNDPTYGYFGSLTSYAMGNCYKVKNNLKQDGKTTIVPCNGYDCNKTTSLTLRKNYTWFGAPYQASHDINDLFGSANEGDRIISKDGGFAEYGGNYWIGDLTTITPGKGYLYYNAGAAKTVTLPEEDGMGMFGMAKAFEVSEASVWEYDHTAFADNMTIIAAFDNIKDASDYSLGAFVGDECRGRGNAVDGKFFVTVHGNTGEMIHFVLFNKYTNEYVAVENTMALSKTAGSLKTPVALSADMTSTGITAVAVNDAVKGANYNIAGQRVNDSAKGLVIAKGSKSARKVMK